MTLEVFINSHNDLENNEPIFTDLCNIPGSVVLEFGASWCGHCRNLAPVLAMVMASQPDVRHIKIEDGPGRALGRFFRVKLWPTLVFLRNGEMVAKYVRPDVAEIQAGFLALTDPKIGL